VRRQDAALLVVGGAHHRRAGAVAEQHRDVAAARGPVQARRGIQVDAVHPDRREIHGKTPHQHDRLFRDGVREPQERTIDGLSQAQGFGCHRQRPGIEPAQRDRLLDHAAELAARLEDLAEELAPAALAFVAVEQDLGVPLDHRQRRTQLVADDRQEVFIAALSGRQGPSQPLVDLPQAFGFDVPGALGASRKG
jgi:hypothetical protein